MLYNIDFYERCVEIFEIHINDMFCGHMKQLVRSCTFKDHRSFRLSYEYVTLKYTVTIESEMGKFWIEIKDEEKASTYLSRIKKHDFTLNEKNIYDAVCLLKKVLDEDNFNLYFSRGNKLYRKNKQGIKRIKEIREFLSGEIE